MAGYSTLSTAPVTRSGAVHASAWALAQKWGAAVFSIGFFAASLAAPIPRSEASVYEHGAAYIAHDPVHNLRLITHQNRQEAARTQRLQTADLDAPIIHLTTAEIVEISAGTKSPSGAEFSLADFLFRGVINWGGYKFTFYSQQVLPGGGLAIPGRHVNAGGYVSDSDGYIVLAGSAPMGTVFETPFGYQGKIYDRGTVGNHLDVYIR